MMARNNVINLDDFRGLAVSQDMAAREFARVYNGQLAFCHSRGKWYEFNDYTWVMQNKPIAFHYARELARRLSSVSSGGAELQKVRFCQGVETFSRADPIFAREFSDWDIDPYLLGTPGGTIHLKTGELRQSSAVDYISRSTAVIPDEFEDCPTWMKFIDAATGGDKQLARYLQQISGYCLTADTREQCLFFIYGEGGRGKGTFVNTIQAIMGEYALTSAMETFEASKHLSHTTSIAMLNGARMVTSSETEEGRQWAEARIKNLTGQDPITARFMRQDDFTFIPKFKLVIIGNFQPSLKTVDEAMRRRFNIIPFNVRPTRVDKHLPEKLKAEWPGILRWAINGCLDWQAHGFIKPDAVTRATNEYFDDQNTFGHWLEEYCDVDDQKKRGVSSATELFTSWNKYAKANGEDAGSQKTFGQTLIRNGFPKKKTKTGAIYMGIALRTFGDEVTGDGR